MTRYILIDNCSGFIWGDSADLNGRAFIGTPAEYAVALDASIGERGRGYTEVGPRDLASNETGYHVYRASGDMPVVDDGQDTETIRAIGRDCAYVTTLRCTNAEG